jgi:hypothetical protein
MIKLFGIRHHGAGSCKRLKKALAAFAPDIIAIEGVEETDGLMQYLRKNGSEFKLPVAMLLYNPKDFAQAVYYPFAEFSPEWQAMTYAATQNIPVANIDLPQSIRFAIHKQKEEAAQTETPQTSEAEATPAAAAEANVLQRDPIGYLAQLAGYPDGEQWWEVMFEQHDDEQLFESIENMMQALRNEISADEEQPLDLMREAYMRQRLRLLEKEGHQRIAVICGAYHCPALRLDAYKAKDDTALLKPYIKIKNTLQATWIPWTYERLSRSSGYGAGVVAPAWYGFLYENQGMATINWLTRVAVALRNADIDSSSAHVIEAVRLAETLAAMRSLALPTLAELNEATISVLLAGDAEKLQLIIQQLVIGNQIGSIPDAVPMLPLQQDINALIKQLKLTKYLTEPNWIKKTATSPQGGLDLREAHDREQSQFLHRLNLLGINWGTASNNTGREQSTKNEYWSMRWQPDYALLIIEASVWGNNLYLAATAATIDAAKHCSSISQLSKMLEQALKANLPLAFEQILTQLQNISALNKDVDSLLAMLPHLVQISRYGDVRQTNTQLVAQLIDQTTPRICILLPNACIGISHELALVLQKHIVAAHRALLLYQHPVLLDNWNEALRIISEPSAHTQAYLKGIATRLLFDNQQYSADQAAQLMQFALSNGNAKIDAAQWIEGFLFSSGLLLIHNIALWQILNQWLLSLDSAIFVEMLPILRRTFSRFSTAERQKMLTRATQPIADIQLPSNDYNWHEQRQELFSPILKKALQRI